MEVGGAGGRGVSGEVGGAGGAGGRGAVVIPEGPGESPVTKCCAPVNRHVGREGGETGKCTCDKCHLLVMKTCGDNLFHTSSIQQ